MTRHVMITTGVYRMMNLMTGNMGRLSQSLKALLKKRQR